MNDTMIEVATTALGFAECTVVRLATVLPDGLEGAYLALIGDTDSIQIGLASTAEGCQLFSKALMGTPLDSPDILDLPDVADAMSEIVNILAGGLKRRMNGRGPPIKLGLPLFVKGTVQPSGLIVMLVAEMLVGHIPAAMVLIQPRGKDAAFLS